MEKLFMTRDIILAIGWPVLIAGSVYLFIRGRHVYDLVKGSLVGKVLKVLVYSMMVGMYSLGIVSTALMFYNIEGVVVVIPVFIVWAAMFVWTIKVLLKAEKEARTLSGN